MSHYARFCLLILMFTPFALAQEINDNEAESVLVYEADFFAGANPATAKDMVDRLPGFRIADGDDVRGFAGAGGNVLINGARPASKSDTASSVLGRTPASRVERIELIRGTVPGIDMQGHSVVVNVILRRESSRQHAAWVQANVFEGGPYLPSARYEFNAGENGREWGFTVGRMTVMSDSTGSGHLLRRNVENAIILQETVENEFDSGGWAGRANWSDTVGAGRLELTGGVNTFTYENWLSMRSTTGQRQFEFNDSVTNADAGLRYQRQVSPVNEVELRMIRQFNSSESWNRALSNDVVQRFDTERDKHESILRAVLYTQYTPVLRLETGAELAWNMMDTTQRFTINNEEVHLPLASTRVSEERGEIFSQASWRYSESLRVEAGVRLEQSTIRQQGSDSAERRFFYPKPRLAMIRDSGPGQQLRLRLERELGQLNFQDFAASTSLSDSQLRGGNRDLRPQQRWIAEAVYEYRFNAEGVLAFTLRHDQITHVIDVIPLEGGLTAIGNIGDGTLNRAELNLRLPLAILNLQGARLIVNARYDHTRVTDPTTGHGREISGARPFTASIRLEQDVPAYRLSWGVEHRPYLRDTTFNPDQRRDMEFRNYNSFFVEHTINEGFTARLDITLWDDFRIHRTTYSDRETRQLAFTEDQRINPRRFATLRLRKTF